MWPPSDPPSDESSQVDAFYDPVEMNGTATAQTSPQSGSPPAPARKTDAVEGLSPQPQNDGANAPSRQEILSRSLKGKDKEWTAVAEKKRPLQLLDLPLDILREIIGQLPHTNDLTALALCHSVFHALCIPCIYSRFDIVWPDASVDSTSRAGVDALTYGLSTLVMAEEVFREAPWQQQLRQEQAELMGEPVSSDPYPLGKRRIGNNYARYTKKFSLGNGPAEWVQEYLITKEGGKMLGTLVALAVARMRNLEAFIWDMPTGVLRDIWLSLSSLATTDDGQECRLEKIWIRWHNNSQLDHPDAVPPPPPQLNNLPPAPPVTHSLTGGLVPTATTVHPALPAGALPIFDRVEYPTFSVLPPLKSISVLDIDELPYLDELSILIARSQRRLKELRIGIAEHAQSRDWVSVWEGEGVLQVDYNTPWTIASKISEKRLGGVLGILVGRVYNLRNNGEEKRKLVTTNIAPEQLEAQASSSSKAPAVSSTPAVAETSQSSDQPGAQAGNVEPTTSAAPVAAEDGTNQHVDQSERDESTQMSATTKSIPLRPAKTMPFDTTRKNGPLLHNKLRLETLELERVPLSMTILQKAFDWSKLTNLTLLDCMDHELLWRVLRRHYSPTSPYNAPSGSSSKATSSRNRFEYPLNLKKIHTNTVSPALIQFLRETVAPNSLEVLFLQETQNYTSSVSIDAIYRGPIRRHRGSLKKLMVDSSGGESEFVSQSSRWRRWMLKREHITFITSGRMCNLRELGITIGYSDWHYFLQKLPSVSHVRSLYIPHIADHPHGANIDLRDLGLQLLDIVALRPEVELCYVGIASKCFEILENKPTAASRGDGVDPRDALNQMPGSHNATNTTPIPGYQPLTTAANMMLDEDDEEDVDEEEEGVLDEEDEGETESEMGDVSEDDDEEFWGEGGEGRGRGLPKLRLREILFYDDKVSVFRARHGHL